MEENLSGENPNQSESIGTHYYKPGSILVNRYKLIKLIGTGGMGLVYLAYDQASNKEIAIKILHKDLIDEGDYLTRFLNEVSIMSGIDSPNVIKTYDSYSNSEITFFTMEYVKGKSLEELLEQGACTIDLIPKLIFDITEGLRVIHSNDIIHRDLKPGNILLNQEGVFKITDFGVARTKSSRLTGKDMKVGSICYMAPELWKGEAPQPTSDFYALGMMLFELVTGQLPFEHNNPAEVMKRHLKEIPPLASSLNKKIPLWLDKVISKLLEKNPKNRFQSIQEIKNQLLFIFASDQDKSDYLEKMRSYLKQLNLDEDKDRESQFFTSAYKRQPTVVISLTGTRNRGGAKATTILAGHKKTVLIPLPKKSAIAFEFEFPTLDFLFLGIFLVSLNVFDGVLTSMGVGRFGIESEGNVFLRNLMFEYGPDLVLSIGKAFAIFLVLLLTILARKSKHVKNLIGALSCIYLFAAILPWLFILFVRDSL